MFRLSELFTVEMGHWNTYAILRLQSSVLSSQIIISWINQSFPCENHCKFSKKIVSRLCGLYNFHLPIFILYMHSSLLVYQLEYQTAQYYWGVCTTWTWVDFFPRFSSSLELTFFTNANTFLIFLFAECSWDIFSFSFDI